MHPFANWNQSRDVWEVPGVADLFSEHLDVYSETFPASGTMRNGVAYELPTWEPRTDDTGSSSSPPDEAILRTPCAAEAEGGMMNPAKARAEGRTVRLSSQMVDLVNPEQLLMTPVASEGTKPSNTMGVERRLSTGQVFLTNQIVSLCGLDPLEKLLPTPSANIGDNGGSQHPDKRRAGNHQPSIQDVAEHLLTGDRMSQPSDAGNQLWEDVPLPLPNQQDATETTG